MKSLLCFFFAIALVMPGQASARTIFLHLLSPTDSKMGLMSDVDTFVQKGLLTEEERKASIEGGETLFSSLRGLIENAGQDGMIFAGRPAAALVLELDSIDLMFDFIPKYQGFSPLGAKASEISSSQFHNVPSRRLITWPAWMAKSPPLHSAFLKEMSRGVVHLGILAHEVFSILGVPDADYDVSTELLLRTVFTGEDRTFKAAAEWQPLANSQATPTLIAGGVSIVGGAGNDLAFAFKLLLRSLGHQLKGGRLAEFEHPVLKSSARALQKKFSESSDAMKGSFVEALDRLIVEEAQSRVQGSGPAKTSIEIVRHSALQRYGVRLTDIDELEKAIKLDPGALDPLVLRIADSIFGAILQSTAMQDGKAP
jgi:hypothetical protein